MSRTAVIMQPTYLPWLGYFDLIDQSDVCVFLDDAQFSRQSWHQRNQVRTAKGLEWLTVPVKKKGRSRALLNQVEVIRDTGFPQDHLRGIECSYAKAPFFNAYFSRLREILSANESILSTMNMRLIRWLARELNIETRFEMSSVLETRGRRSELMIDICQRVGADTYLSPAGAAYLTQEFDTCLNRDLNVLFHDYNHPTYRQAYEPFMPYASVVDLLFNAGDDSLGIIRSGRKESIPLKHRAGSAAGSNN